MDEIRRLLTCVPDAYDGFIDGVFRYVKGHKERESNLKKYISTHPEADSSDVIRNVLLTDPDFWTDDEECKTTPKTVDPVAALAG